MTTKILSAYECHKCQARFQRPMGKCGMCGEFNSIAEIPIQNNNSIINNSKFSSSQYTSPQLLIDIPDNGTIRYSTNIKEIDRVLGGGIVLGMVILIGGEPGIGKSTLMLQIASSFNGSVLYASGEENEEQIKIRAKRLITKNEAIYIYAVTDVRQILTVADNIKPSLLLIDSIQTLYDPEINSSIGSINQLRECTALLTRWAKNTNTPIILAGHITKDGIVAGPKILEHIVDTVLIFEGDRYHHNRLLRTLKNRFGATSELGIFDMTNQGLIVTDKNPFFSKSEINPGSAITIILSGTRPIVVEIQALVSSTITNMPKRVALGIDGQRLTMLCAVAERRGGIKLHNKDVFLNIVGGLNIEDPAADLAVIAAITSSITSRALAQKTIFLGEVGLTGEIRPITKLPIRLQEASRSSFTQTVVPKINFATTSSIHSNLNILFESNLHHLASKSWLL